MKNPADDADMVWIPPSGDCWLGDVVQSNNPRHKCSLDGYWIYKSPVTVAQYFRFCQATGRHKPLEPDGGWQDDRPIVNVTWDDALSYAHWACLTLPTEAQWERAARGTDERVYPWGSGWDPKRLCHSENSWDGHRRTPEPIGSYPNGASPYGVLDMAGNVRQWCADYYAEDYPKHAPAKNPSGPALADQQGDRVVRGSGFNVYFEGKFVASNRDHDPHDRAFPTTGFRCASPVYAPL